MQEVKIPKKEYVDNLVSDLGDISVPGPQGDPGILIPLPINTNLFAVGISDGHLIMTYAEGSDPPPLSIDNRGHLMWGIESAQEMDLGVVVRPWIPDYAAMESTNRITANNGMWTVDRNGFVKVQGSWYRTPGLTIKINNTTVCSIDGASSTAGQNIIHHMILPVAIGDVISIAAYAAWGCYYIPPREDVL